MQMHYLPCSKKLCDSVIFVTECTEYKQPVSRLEMEISGKSPGHGCLIHLLIISVLRIKITPGGCPVGRAEGTPVSNRSKE